jgi:hypothetical protein
MAAAMSQFFYQKKLARGVTTRPLGELLGELVARMFDTKLASAASGDLQARVSMCRHV